MPSPRHLACATNAGGVSKGQFFDTPDVFILNLLQVVTNTYVNIVDLVDARGTRVITKFPSEKALSIYTIETRKFFPRENAYAGGLLRALLRRILNPPDEPSRQGQRRGTVRRVRRSR